VVIWCHPNRRWPGDAIGPAKRDGERFGLAQVRGQVVKTYRCYFVDQKFRVRAIRRIACKDDAAAIAKVRNLLKQNLYHAAELWHREHWVGEWQSGSDPQTPPYPWAGKTIHGLATPERAALDDTRFPNHELRHAGGLVKAHAG
jgi:hypothetical protein